MLIDPYGEIFSFHWEVRVRLKVRIMELVRIHISGHRHHSKSKYYWKINTGCIKPHETDSDHAAFCSLLKKNTMANLEI